MPNTVEEATVMVGLHARLDTIERERGEGGKDAGGAGGDLCAVPLDEDIVAATGVNCRGRAGGRHLLFVAASSSGARHGDRGCSWSWQWRRVAWDMLVKSSGVSSHSSPLSCRRAKAIEGTSDGEGSRQERVVPKWPRLEARSQETASRQSPEAAGSHPDAGEAQIGMRKLRRVRFAARRRFQWIVGR